MKKLFVTFISAITMIVSSFAFGGCGADNFTEKQYRLSEISAVYDNAASEEAKTDCENKIQTVRATIGTADNPYCTFYKFGNTSILLTNCNGTYRLTKYAVNGGKVSIDVSTAESPDKYRLPIRQKFLKDDSLERATLQSDGDRLSLMETIEGITITYTFVKDGEADISTDYGGNRYKFIDVEYMSYTTDEEKNKNELQHAEQRLKDFQFGGTAWFPDSSKCKLSGGISFERNYDCRLNEKLHFIEVGNAETNEWNPKGFYIYGDLLIYERTSTGAKYGIYTFFVKEK